MKRSIYPFASIVGQEPMKLALLLAAIDWRLSVLLRGDKGAGKTTTARGLAALLPEPAPFINLPIGVTEDRLLGGLHLESTLKGQPALKPGLLAEAHQGVLYIDEINLLPPHLGDTLLDVASSGINVVEREGFSVSHPSEFVLLGSMNPEEGLLRPQLLDRFALAVDIIAPFAPGERQMVVTRRIAFERDPEAFAQEWQPQQESLQVRIIQAREYLPSVTCPDDILMHISETICTHGIRSLRADLAAVRAGAAYAALMGETIVRREHIDAVMPFVLGHRAKASGRSAPTPPQPTPSPQQESEPSASNSMQEAIERIFTPKQMDGPALKTSFEDATRHGSGASISQEQRGPVIRNHRTETPREIDVRATLNHSLMETGKLNPGTSNLHEKVRQPFTGTRYLFVIDSSGSHAMQEKMARVKGSVIALLQRSFKRGDEVAMIAFRGASAQVLLEPCRNMEESLAALEYLPTGGRTPLAHALELAGTYTTPTTLIVLLTDGRGNVSLQSNDPWQEALDIAVNLKSQALVIDTEGAPRMGRAEDLAKALRARYATLDNLEESEILMGLSPQD